MTDTTSTPHGAAGQQGHGAAHAHVLPPRVLLGTAAALLALTAVTVASAQVDLGRLNVAVALAIAASKAALVALFFMHLKYQQRFLAVVLGAAVAFAVLMVSFVVFDTTQYQPDVRAHEAAAARDGVSVPEPAASAGARAIRHPGSGADRPRHSSRRVIGRARAPAARSRGSRTRWRTLQLSAANGEPASY